MKTEDKLGTIVPNKLMIIMSNLSNKQASYDTSIIIKKGNKIKDDKTTS